MDNISDYLELQELLARYAYVVDFSDDVEEFMSLFTDDAVLEAALWNEHRGTEGIRHWANTTIEMRKEVKMRHYLSNVRIDHRGDEAHIHAYLIAVYRRPVMETIDATQVLYGAYDCTARRTEDGWRLLRRKVHLDVTTAGTVRD